MAKGAATVKANCRSQRVAGSQLPVSPARSSLGLPSRARPRYQHPMFVTWVHRTAEGYYVPLAWQPVNMRHLKTLLYAIRQQERPDVPDDEVPLEPTGRGRSRTPRDASAEMLTRQLKCCLRPWNSRISTKWAQPPSTSCIRPLIRSTRLYGSP